MTFDEYLEAVRAALKEQPRWRTGQAHFNVLYEQRSDLSEPIRSTMLDPFHDDTRLDLFLRVVKERW